MDIIEIIIYMISSNIFHSINGILYYSNKSCNDKIASKM